LPLWTGSWARRVAASLSVILIIMLSGCGRRTVGAWVATGSFYATKAAAWTTKDAPIWIAANGAQVFRIDDDELEPDEEAGALLTSADAQLRTIWGTSASDVWLHACLHFDGSEWHRTPPIDLPPDPPSYTGIPGPKQVAECMGSVVYGAAPGHYHLAFNSASTWEVELGQDGWAYGPLPAPGAINLSDTPLALHGTAVDDVHLVGANRALHYDGEWRDLHVDENHVLHSVWARTRTEAYAVGGPNRLPARGVLLRYDGASWSESLGPPGEAYRWVSGRGADELLVATDRIVYQRQPDGTWTELFAAPGESPEILCLHQAEDVVVVCVRNNDQRVTIWIKR